MRLRELTSGEIRDRVRKGALRIRTGPFIARIQSRFPAVAEAIEVLYADFPLIHDDRFADFHVALRRAPGLKGLVNREAVLLQGGLPAFYAFPKRLAAPYLEWGLNWCVYNVVHRFLAVHSATLERNGRAMMLVGRSGTGKSTLAAAMALGGWRLLSDELALIDLDRGAFHALARPLSLKNESIGIIRRRAASAVFSPTYVSPRKGSVAHVRPPREAVERMDEVAAPGAILFVNYQAGATADLQRVHQGTAMIRVAANAFNYSLLAERGFHTLADVVDRSNCYRLTFSDLDEALDRLGDVVEPWGTPVQHDVSVEPVS